ncbi:MAG: ATP-binding cassette domain-containing protein [Firmicutes bacterium]|nr:ATP-binding cassette domain-containing protein [Bacillota bacterium]
MLTLKHITKKYRDKTALDDVTLELDRGIYGLLGPNGAGKSTLMNIITGNIKPTNGEVLWDNSDIRTLGADFRSLIGYAPQQQGLYNSFSGRRFLSYMAALKGIPKKEVHYEIKRVLSYVNMQEAADRAIGSYSGGMKQRILIAQAILGAPKLIVLDEPTAGLDPKERVRIREQIKALAGDRIILVSTHVVSDIAPIAKEILLIRSGSIVDRDTVETLCQRYGESCDLEEVYMHIFGEEERHAAADSL